MLSARFDRTVSTWQPQVEDMSDALGNWAAVHGRHVSRKDWECSHQCRELATDNEGLWIGGPQCPGEVEHGELCAVQYPCPTSIRIAGFLGDHVSLQADDGFDMSTSYLLLVDWGRSDLWCRYRDNIETLPPSPHGATGRRISPRRARNLLSCRKR